MPEGLHYFTTLGQILRISVFVCYTIIFVIGFVNAVAPKWMWKTFESWKAVKEPTNTYFITKRITGIIIMVVVAIITFVPIFAYMY